MFFSILQEGISEVSKLFLKGKLQKWWGYHKIDKHVARVISDTCEDEGFNLDELLNRLGISGDLIKKRLIKLKKSFKEKKSFTAIENFIDELVETYLDFILKVDESIYKDNPLNSEELDLLEKIKTNIKVYLTNFKPIETIAYISINLKKLEIQNREYYDKLVLELNDISSQSKLVPDYLNNIREQVENALNKLQEDHRQILKEVKQISDSKKIKDTISFNELIDIKIGFKDVQYKDKAIAVQEKYMINIQADSKIPFETTKFGVNIEPLEAFVVGKRIVFDEKNEGFYIFNLPEPINCRVGKTLVASVNLNGPKPNFKYKLYVILEGEVKQDEMIYHIKKSRGPFEVERESLVSNLILGLVDTFVDPNFSKKIKKLQDDGEEKYL
ncbi:MAG: hypothetical protein ACFFCV_12105 [Promethearchaeota archaeon]